MGPKNASFQVVSLKVVTPQSCKYLDYGEDMEVVGIESFKNFCKGKMKCHISLES